MPSCAMLSLEVGFTALCQLAKHIKAAVQLGAGNKAKSIKQASADFLKCAHRSISISFSFSAPRCQ